MSTLTYQEKSLYGVLIAEFAVFIPYFIRAAHGHTSLVRVSGLFFLVTILQIVIQGIIGAVSRNRIKDERDRLIEARDLRAAAAMTQQDLADKIGVTRQTVIAIELDKYSPSLEVAFRIAHVFKVPLDQVFQYTPPRSPRK